MKQCRVCVSSKRSWRKSCFLRRLNFSLKSESFSFKISTFWNENFVSSIQKLVDNWDDTRWKYLSPKFHLKFFLFSSSVKLKGETDKTRIERSHKNCSNSEEKVEFNFSDIPMKIRRFNQRIFAFRRLQIIFGDFVSLFHWFLSFFNGSSRPRKIFIRSFWVRSTEFV